MRGKPFFLTVLNADFADTPEKHSHWFLDAHLFQLDTFLISGQKIIISGQNFQNFSNFSRLILSCSSRRDKHFSFWEWVIWTTGKKVMQLKPLAVVRACSGSGRAHALCLSALAVGFNIVILIELGSLACSCWEGAFNELSQNLFFFKKSWFVAVLREKSGSNFRHPLGDGFWKKFLFLWPGSSGSEKFSKCENNKFFRKHIHFVRLDEISTFVLRNLFLGFFWTKLWAKNWLLPSWRREFEPRWGRLFCN